MLSVTLEWHGATAVLVVVGEVDMASVSRFEEALNSALGERPGVLVVDMTKVEFFASTGINALVAAQQQADTDTAVRVVAGNRATLRPLEITGVDHTIPVYSAVAAALAGE